MIKAMNAIC